MMNGGQLKRHTSMENIQLPVEQTIIQQQTLQFKHPLPHRIIPQTQYPQPKSPTVIGHRLEEVVKGPQIL